LGSPHKLVFPKASRHMHFFLEIVSWNKELFFFSFLFFKVIKKRLRYHVAMGNAKSTGPWVTTAKRYRALIQVRKRKRNLGMVQKISTTNIHKEDILSHGSSKL
jgi:hypothetical protein